MGATSLHLGVVVGGVVGASFSSAISTSKHELITLGKETAKLTAEQRKLQGYSDRKANVQAALESVNARKKELELSKKNKEVLLEEIRLGKIKGLEAVTALKTVNSEIKKGESELTKTEGKYQRLLSQLRDYARQAEKAGVSLSQHKVQLDKVGQALERNTRKAEVYQKIISHKAQLSEAYGELGRGAAATVSMGMVVRSTINSFAAYEVGMQRIGATAAMNKAEIIQMREELLKVSNDKGIAHDKLQNTLGIMVAGGVKPEAAIKALPLVGDLIKAYDMQAEDIGQASVALLDNLEYSTTNLGRAWEIMGQAGKDGQFEARDMAKYTAGLGASMKALHVVGDEGTATMAGMLQIARKGAGNSEEAANNMKNFLAKIVSSKTEKKAKEFGFSMHDLIAKAQKEGKNPIEEAVKKISEVTHGDQVKIAAMFDDMEVQNFLRPMIQNYKEYEEIKKRALDAKGIVDKDASDVDATSDAKINKIGAAWGRLKTRIGGALAPAFNLIVVGATLALNALEKIAKTRIGGTLIAGVVGLGLGISGAFSIYQLYRIGRLVAGIMGLRKEIQLLGGASNLLKSPLGKFGLKGAGAALGAYGLYQIWNDDKNKGAQPQTWGQRLKSYGKGAMSGAAIGMMFGPVGAVVGAVLGLAYTGVVRNWDKIGSVTKSKLSSLKNRVGGYWNEIRQHPIKTLAAIGKTILNWSPIGLFYKAFSAVTNYFGVQLPSDFTGFGKMILQGLVNGFTSMFPTVTGKIVEIGRAIKNRFSGNGEGGQDMHSPARVWHGFGDFMMQGLSLGLTHRAPSVYSTVSRIGQSIKRRFKPAVTPSFDVYQFRASLDAAAQTSGASAAGGASSAGLSIVNHFHISQQAGEDAEAFARRIVTMIEQKAGLRRRSALADLA